MKLMVDENLPPSLARALHELFSDEHEVVFIVEKFGRRGVKDLDWILELGSEGSWSILTADVRLSKNKIERNAFLSNKLVGFVLGPILRKKPLHLQAARILTVWQMMVNQSMLVESGIFEIGERSRKFKSM